MLNTSRKWTELLRYKSFSNWQGVLLLAALFLLWKAILFAIVALAPGPGYDTSTSLLVDTSSRSGSAVKLGEVATTLPCMLKFVRWDAIYFTQIAQRGSVYEQEAAFDSGFAQLLAFLQKGT